MGRPHSYLVLQGTAVCLYSVTCQTLRSLVLHHHHHFRQWRHLGGMEAHVMAVRTLFGLFSLPGGRKFCAMFIFLWKVIHERAENAAQHKKRIAPKSIEMPLLPQVIAQAFCGSVLR